MNRTKKKLTRSILKLERWVEDHDYRGYEPFDGLSSFVRPLTFGNLFLDRLLMQLVRQSPVNLRPLLGIKPLDSTIGRGYMAWGYLQRLKITGETIAKLKTLKASGATAKEALTEVALETGLSKKELYQTWLRL